MGFKPERFKKGSGNILRKVLQQLENAGYVKKDKTGRIVTPNGQKFMDSMARTVPNTETYVNQRQAEAAAQIQAAPVRQNQPTVQASAKPAMQQQPKPQKAPAPQTK